MDPCIDLEVTDHHSFCIQVVLFIGVTLLLASTYMTLYDQDRHARDSVVKIAPPPPLNVKGDNLGSMLDKPLDLPLAETATKKDGVYATLVHPK